MKVSQMKVSQMKNRRMGSRLCSPGLTGIVAVCLLLGSCARPAPDRPTALVVFAAVSLTEAFDDIGAAFAAQHPGVRVVFNFGGSQNLRTQLEQGATADVFAAANLAEMDKAVAASLVTSGSVRIFMTNQLVVIVPAANPAQIHSLTDLTRPGLKLVLAAPEVPAGQYARVLLRNLDAIFGAGYEAQVLANVVSNEDNVRQAVAKVQLGEADAAIVYASDAVAAPTLRTLAIPASANVVARYPIAVLSAAAQPDLATAFVQMVLAPDGQAILRKWGFTPVD